MKLFFRYTYVLCLLGPALIDLYIINSHQLHLYRMIMKDILTNAFKFWKKMSKIPYLQHMKTLINIQVKYAT